MTVKSFLSHPVRQRVEFIAPEVPSVIELFDSVVLMVAHIPERSLRPKIFRSIRTMRKRHLNCWNKSWSSHSFISKWLKHLMKCALVFRARVSCFPILLLPGQLYSLCSLTSTQQGERAQTCAQVQDRKQPVALQPPTCLSPHLHLTHSP